MGSKKLAGSQMKDEPVSEIPPFLTVEFAQNWLKGRLSEKRFAHTKGVAKVAEKIATALAMDATKPVLAAWLHDACKEVKDKELVSLAEGYGLVLNAIEKANGHLLHGPVAAEVIRAEFGLTDEGILNAIREHTLGNVAMTQLSQVVFLADCLDESRPQDYTQPIWQALDLAGRVDLDRAMLVALDAALKHLLESCRVIHPLSVEARNYYLKLLDKRS
jgi:predicted HD superfamily hydrolase involved in NAD metabolism